MHLDVSALQWPEPHHTWTGLDLFGQQEHVLLLEISTPQGPELHLNVSGQQEPLLLLHISTLQGPELQLDGSGQQEPVLVWTWQHRWKGAELHLDVSTLQRHMQYPDVSTPQEPDLHMDAQDYRSLCYSQACLHLRPELHLVVVLWLYNVHA